MEFQELWDIDQVATYLGVRKQTIYGWRTTGYGPRVPGRQAPALARGDGHPVDARSGERDMIVEEICPRCGTSFYEPHPRKPGRPRRWCTQACRRAASEERRAAANGAIAIEHVPVAVSLDEHVRAVLDSPAACRRVLRDLRERSEAGLLQDARWDSVQSEIERLQQPKPRALLRWGHR